MAESNPGRPVPFSDAADAEAAGPAPAAAFCRGCGYSLRGLPSGKCPECGRPFDLADRRTVSSRPPRARLRWWAWRVGLLALLLTLAAESVPGWYWWGWHREQAVIAAVRGAGGSVLVGWVEPGGAAKFLPARWAFLHDRAGIVELRYDATAVLDRVDLSPLVHVRGLVLVNCRVTDPVLAQLRGMTRLEQLDLPDNPRLDGTGLRHLAGCRALTGLVLRRTGLTDAGLAEVGKRTSLTDLYIQDAPVTDAGMGHLAGLTSLQLLDLRETHVTDAGMVPLRGLTSLRYLFLSDTGVTDAGMVPLRGLTSLQSLHLAGTKVTAQGRRDLQKALPNLTIHD